MEYDVTGTLKIDTEAFEKALKDAQKRIDAFREDLQSLGKLSKEMGFKDLSKSMKELEGLLDKVVVDFEKADSSVDDLTESVENLKKETKSAGAEVDKLQSRINRLKLDKSFTKDFYNLVSQAEGTQGVELRPVYDKLKKDYKDLVKNKADFEKLFTRAVERTNTRLYPSRDPDKFVDVGGRNFGYIDRRQLVAVDELSARLEKADAKVEELQNELKQLSTESNNTGSALEGWDSRLYDATQEMNRLRTEAKKVKKEFGEDSAEFKKISADVDKAVKKYQELNKLWGEIHPIEWVTPSTEEMLESLGEEAKELNKDLENTAETSKQLDKSFDQNTESLKKTGTEAEKLKQKLRNIYNPTTTREGLSAIFSKKAQAEYDKNSDFFYKTQEKIMKLKEEMMELSTLQTDLAFDLQKAQSMLDKHGDSHRWSQKWKNDLKTISPEIDKVKAKYESLENEVEQLENEITKSSDNYKKVTDPLYKSISSLQKESKKLGKMVSEPIKKGTSEATKDISEFDKKVAEQMVGLNDMLVESSTFTVEQAEKVNQRIAKSVDSTVEHIRQGISKAQGYIKNLSAGSSGLFDEASRRGKLKKEVASLNGLIEERNRLNAMWRGMQGSSDNPFTARGMSKAKLTNKYKQQFNQYGAGFLGDANIQKDIQLVNEFHRATRKVSASTNQWVNESITGFNNFARSVQKSIAETKMMDATLNSLSKRFALIEKYQYETTGNKSGVGFAGSSQFQEAITGAERYVAELKKIEMQAKKTAEAQMRLTQQYKYNATGNQAGVGFAGSSQFQQMNKGLQEYNKLSNIANLNTQRMGLGFEKFGQYSQKAESHVRSFGGVLRSLRTTMSMIGGMFVWEFAFKIMDATRATISAKSEMESYYKTLNMGNMEIASFNRTLDKTIGKFQKMNKFQLGETITALGVEFKMTTDEMNQVMKVAPMIVNEYLRAGRSTEEAILAIKDISQGEFLRLSRETGVGSKEIKDAGWSGDNKDILSLYQALEKIGKARHWDVFAQKAQSLNDVMLITENRMTEFTTLLSDAVTPVIVSSFNALGDAFNSASKWYEGLSGANKLYVQIATLGAVGLTTAGVFNSHLLPAIKNFGTNMVSSFLGVDSAVAKEKGLAQAIAHETAVERIANIERTNGQKVLHAKIMTLKEEELANKLSMSTKKLKLRYDHLQNQALNIENKALKTNTAQEKINMLMTRDGLTVEQARTKVTKARTLAQRSLILAEEQGITTGQAMKILLEEEKLAEMGTVKALFVRKMGLDATIVSEEGMVSAIASRILAGDGYIATLVGETMATLGLESATATLIITLGLVVAPLVAIGLVVAPLIQQFAELQASYSKVNDTLQAGQERIDTLAEKQKKLQTTYDELNGKTNRTTDEEKKLDRTRKQLNNTNKALKKSTEELAYANKMNTAYEDASNELDAQQYDNKKKINKYYQDTTGSMEDLTDKTYGMGKATKDMVKNMEYANYMEKKRPERFKDLAESLKDSSLSQEEYNKKLKEFGTDWNDAYTKMEDSKRRMADPSADMWSRLGAMFNFEMGSLEKDWIEFWADPWANIEDVDNSGFLKRIKGMWFGEGELSDFFVTEDFKKSLEDSLSKISIQDILKKAWFGEGNISDFFVREDFNPLEGMQKWWGDTNAWLESMMPDISVDNIKEWFGKHVREPFQQAWNDFWKNPFGGGEQQQQQGAGGGTATKTFSIGNLFKFDFKGLRTSFDTGIRNAINNVPNILQVAGGVWSKIGGNNALHTVQSVAQNLSGVKTTVSQKFNEGASTLRGFVGKFRQTAHGVGKSIYDGLKNGIGNLVQVVRSKFDGIASAISGTISSISSAVGGVVDAITNPLNGINIPFLSGFSLWGYPTNGANPSRPKRVRIHSPRMPTYGSLSNVGFESALRGMLTAQGFRRPSSYQFYPNSMKTTAQTWDDGSANCYDGAKLIVGLANMFGLKGKIVTGNWNGMGHAGAMVGGKLYDMTQFQRRGVFRGTKGVHFGGNSGKHYGASTNNVTSSMTVNVNVNGTVYGSNDFKEKIEKVAEDVFIRYHDENPSVGV